MIYLGENLVRIRWPVSIFCTRPQEEFYVLPVFWEPTCFFPINQPHNPIVGHNDVSGAQVPVCKDNSMAIPLLSGEGIPNRSWRDMRQVRYQVLVELVLVDQRRKVMRVAESRVAELATTTGTHQSRGSL